MENGKLNLEAFKANAIKVVTNEALEAIQGGGVPSADACHSEGSMGPQ